MNLFLFDRHEEQDPMVNLKIMLIDDECELEIWILWPTCLYRFNMRSTRSILSAMHTKPNNRRINIREAEVVVFEERFFNPRITTVHGTETKSLIPLFFT